MPPKRGVTVVSKVPASKAGGGATGKGKKVIEAVVEQKTAVVAASLEDANDESSTSTTIEAAADMADSMSGLDAQYNPEMISTILQDLEQHLLEKCAAIQRETVTMTTIIMSNFHFEMIKLPKEVKEMSVSKFQSEFGGSIEAVTRGAIAGSTSLSSSRSNTSSSAATAGSSSVVKSSRSSSRVFQTPSHRNKHSNIVAETPSSRHPKEGEIILSSNGSPLGEYASTVVKPGRPNAASSFVPATPGIHVPLTSGEIVDLESADIDSMSSDVKQDALAKMQTMMANMQALMQKLAKE